MAAKKKKKVPNTPKNRVNKTAYVLDHPKLSAAEVVALAKKNGIALSDKYVYNIRAKAKAGGVKKRKPGRPKSVGNGVSSAEQSFIDAAMQVGLGRSEQLLSRVRAAVNDALR